MATPPDRLGLPLPWRDSTDQIQELVIYHKGISVYEFLIVSLYFGRTLPNTCATFLYPASSSQCHDILGGIKQILLTDFHTCLLPIFGVVLLYLMLHIFDMLSWLPLSYYTDHMVTILPRHMVRTASLTPGHREKWPHYQDLFFLLTFSVYIPVCPMFTFFDFHLGSILLVQPTKNSISPPMVGSNIPK